MKQLMLGNAAVARGLYEAGCGVVSSYPGTPSTEITEEIAKYDEVYCEWAPNEKVALEVAFGACLARAACCGRGRGCYHSDRAVDTKKAKKEKNCARGKDTPCRAEYRKGGER